MIHYNLVCELDHAFEGWFRSADAFEAQSTAGQIECPVCHSTQVSRGLMAPAVQAGRKKDARAEANATKAMVSADPRRKALVEAIREMKRKITEDADYVGKDFVDEARRIHAGEAEERGIWGEATLADAEALSEEGIAVMPLPTLPDEHN